MKESAVEGLLIRRTKAAGGICMKIMPVVAGYPDRLVLLPRGRFFFVETKAPNGRLRPMQVVFRDRVAKIGFTVAVLYTTKQVNDWMDERLSE